MFLEGGNADAGGHKHIALAKREWFVEACKNFVGNDHGIACTASARVQDDEFVARNTANNTPFWKCITQALSNSNEYVVSGLMTKRVIDVFKAIYVNEQHRWMSLILFGKFKRSTDMGQHEASVWQSSQCIGLRRMDE